MVYAEFGGHTECIMGNWKIENWYNKLDCWRLVPPLIIVLFCLFILITEIFSIRLSVPKENRILLFSANGNFLCVTF